MTIGYLKLDVVSDAVWSTLAEALSAGALRRVQQLGLLVHVTSERHERHLATRHWNVLVELERAGFRRWLALPVVSADTRRHQAGRRRQPTDTYQLGYLNTRFLVYKT